MACCVFALASINMCAFSMCMQAMEVQRVQLAERKARLAALQQLQQQAQQQDASHPARQVLLDHLSPTSVQLTIPSSPSRNGTGISAHGGTGMGNTGSTAVDPRAVLEAQVACCRRWQAVRALLVGWEEELSFGIVVGALERLAVLLTAPGVVLSWQERAEVGFTACCVRPALYPWHGAARVWRVCIGVVLSRWECGECAYSTHMGPCLAWWS